jgi:hypothetical protein
MSDPSGAVVGLRPQMRAGGNDQLR